MAFQHAHVAPPIQPPPDLQQPTQAPLRDERYLHWTLLADALSIYPLVRWGIAYQDDIYLPLPALTLSPFIHALHGEGGKAGISLVMRAAMVGGVYAAGQLAKEECSEMEDDFLCFPMGSMMLMNLSIVSVVVVDALFLAKRTVGAPEWRGLPLVPSVSAGPGGRVSLTIGSQF